MSQHTVRYPIPETSRGLTRRTAVGVLAAITAVLLTQAAVDVVSVELGVTGPIDPFAVGPLVGACIAAGVGAALAYAAVVRVTVRPVRTFLALSAGVFVLMLVPVFGMPPAGITTAGQGILVLYHVLVAVPLVASILGVVTL